MNVTEFFTESTPEQVAERFPVGSNFLITEARNSTRDNRVGDVETVGEYHRNSGDIWLADGNGNLFRGLPLNPPVVQGDRVKVVSISSQESSPEYERLARLRPTATVALTFRPGASTVRAKIDMPEGFDVSDYSPYLDPREEALSIGQWVMAGGEVQPVVEYVSGTSLMQEHGRWLAQVKANRARVIGDQGRIQSILRDFGTDQVRRALACLPAAPTPLWGGEQALGLDPLGRMVEAKALSGGGAWSANVRALLNDRVETGDKFIGLDAVEHEVASIRHAPDGSIDSIVNEDGSTHIVWLRKEVQVPPLPPVNSTVIVENAPWIERDNGKVVAVHSIEGESVRYDPTPSGSTTSAVNWTPVMIGGRYTSGTVLKVTEVAEGALFTANRVMDRAATVVSHLGEGRIEVSIDGDVVQIKAGDVIGHTLSAAKPGVLDEAPVVSGGVDWEQKYNSLVAALAQEAAERDWCSEFEEFCDKNDIDIPAMRHTVKLLLHHEIEAHTLDRILADYMGGDGIDIQEAINVENRVTVEVDVAPRMLRDGVADGVLAEALQEEGFRFDSFDIEDYWR